MSSVFQEYSLYANTIETVDVGFLENEITNSKSEVLIVDFWATFCAPCTKQAPVFSNIYKKYKSKGLSIIGVSFDFDKDRAEKFIKKLAIKYPIYLGNEDVGFQYDINSIPTTHIYDRDGNLVKRYVGLVGEDELTQIIEPLLSAK
ncbi:MAG: putative thiol-disulfide oxidoreductase [Candidatus Scalindua rubra]|uniref:Putative thiol-disulfide oxidoreductase n=1 Tax=Candidatus Scalindua rubra TaxID=1872076 RepID=A0A1E3X406_9BACT|nr:MAG: putative thiol-disulfide oxidoreductase [Candidatus Scalindua rubra]